MITKLLTATLLAAAALAGCNKQSHTFNGDTMADKSAPTVAPIDPASLPPAIAATKTYRCKDNGVVSIDWLSDKMSANVHPAKGTPPVHLKASEAGKPLTAEGYALTGTADSSSVTLTMPGKGSQSCEA